MLIRRLLEFVYLLLYCIVQSMEIDISKINYKATEILYEISDHVNKSTQLGDMIILYIYPTHKEICGIIFIS